MLSYLIVILSFKKLENILHQNEKTDWHEDKQLDTKTKKNLKKRTLPVASAGPPDTEYPHYPLNVDSVTQKHSLLPDYIR